jgi:hypothetical protein
MDNGGYFPGEKKWGRGMKLTTHLQLVHRSRRVELYLHFHISLYGIVFNLLSTGKLYLCLSLTVYPSLEKELRKQLNA